MHRVSLAEHGARLRPGVDYRWFVALVRDPERRSRGCRVGSRDPLHAARTRARSSARGRTAPRAPPTSTRSRASGTTPSTSSRAGSRRSPDAALLHEHRAALLEQVGLDDAAAFERRSEPEGPLIRGLTASSRSAGTAPSSTGVSDSRRARASAAHAGAPRPISSFVNRIVELSPQLITFNGSSFDLPVLRYCAMVHGVAAPGLALRPYFNRYTEDN